LLRRKPTASLKKWGYPIAGCPHFNLEIYSKNKNNNNEIIPAVGVEWLIP